MTKRISAMELRKHLGQIMNEVSLRDNEYIIERNEEPMAVLIPLWKLQQLEKSREQFWKKVQDFRKAGRKAGKQLPIIVEEAVRAARK